jgi:hypothetical protein
MWCTIRIQGHLSEQWIHWLGDLSIENQASGEAVLSGEVADQSALYGILGRMRDMGVVLLALECRGWKRADCEPKARSGESPC